MTPMRLVVSTNVVPPYRISLFEALAEELRTDGGHLTIISWTPDMLGRNWAVEAPTCGFDLHYAGRKPLGRDTQVPRAVLPALSKMLSTMSCDAVISTGFGPESMLAVTIGRFRAIPTFLWSEAVGGSADYDDNALRIVQRRVLGWASTGVVVPGAAAAAYARKFNGNVFTLRNTIDLDLFCATDVVKDPYVLTVGQLRRYRNHTLLIEPIRQAIADGHYERWILVGDGPEMIPLVSACHAALGDRFTHIPHATPNRVAELLQGATCFASVPTRDIWGFAVQEAIMTGLPVVITPTVGCGADLVYPGSGGYITSAGPSATASFAQDVYKGLVKAASWETQERSAAAAVELRKQWTPQSAARSFIAQFRSHLGGRV